MTFSVEWEAALAAAVAEVPGSEDAVRAIRAVLDRAPFTVAEPHIETFGDEVRLTWRRGSLHLDVGAFDDGDVEWFHRAHDGSFRSGEALDEGFSAALAARHGVAP